jgi:hypothetical protein
MTPDEVRKLPDNELIGVLTNLRPTDEAVRRGAVPPDGRERRRL